MLRSPFFSIIIPTYNREKFINRAIESVLQQTFTDFELIIVDDASTDTTVKIIQTYTDSRIRLLQNTVNIERCESRNKGIKMAQGEYICFLDSDDYHLPEHLHTLHKEIAAQKNPKALFFTNSWNSHNGTLTKRVCPPIEHYNLFEYICLYTFNPQRMCIHHSILHKYAFDPEVYVCEDLDIAARIATQYKILQIPKRTTVYVHHEESFTGGDRLKPFKELENYNRIFDKPELRSAIPYKVKRQLRSMCYFHISAYYEAASMPWEMYKSIIRSFVLFPLGYNRKTNKILAVRFLYNIPFIGNMLRKKK